MTRLMWALGTVFGAALLFGADVLGNGGLS